MAKNYIIKVVAISVVLLFLISGFSVMAYGSQGSLINGHKNYNNSLNHNLKQKSILNDLKSEKSIINNLLNKYKIKESYQNLYKTNSNYVGNTLLMLNNSYISGNLNNNINSLNITYLVYDTNDHNLYASTNNGLIVINTTSNTYSGFIPLNITPVQMVYIPSSDEIYVIILLRL